MLSTYLIMPPVKTKNSAMFTKQIILIVVEVSVLVIHFSFSEFH